MMADVYTMVLPLLRDTYDTRYIPSWYVAWKSCSQPISMLIRNVCYGRLVGAGGGLVVVANS